MKEKMVDKTADKNTATTLLNQKLQRLRITVGKLCAEGGDYKPVIEEIKDINKQLYLLENTNADDDTDVQ